MKSVYTASKTKHAAIWRKLRAEGLPIISTWIDEAGAGESASMEDLWRRCVEEASNADVLLIYCEPGDILKGAWVELGAALAAGKLVFAVGIREYTVAHHTGIRHFDSLPSALEELTALVARPVRTEADRYAPYSSLGEHIA